MGTKPGNYANQAEIKTMTKFKIITGAALGNAIKGQASKIATFKAREHELAFSCLHHVEKHSDVCHLNSLLNVTPSNYRRGLILWAAAFGKVTYDAKERAFAFAKGKKSDLDGAESVAPADYEKTSKEGAAKTARTLFERLESVATKTIGDENATAEDKALAAALANFLKANKAHAEKTVKAAPVKAAKPAKVAAPEVAPVVEPEKIAA